MINQFNFCKCKVEVYKFIRASAVYEFIFDANYKFVSI